MSTSILLVDDHTIVTDGLRALLQGVDAYTVKGEARDGRSALALLDLLKIDVVVMDIDMPGMNGIDATKEVKRKHPHIKVLILTMHEERGMIKLLLDAGADGYLLKNSSKQELLQALEGVMNGGQYLSPEVHTVLLKKTEGDKIIASLTDRELEIIRLIAEGLSNKEIGERLFISHRTVDTHRTNLMQKLEIHNVAGLVRWAIQRGLV